MKKIKGLEGTVNNVKNDWDTSRMKCEELVTHLEHEIINNEYVRGTMGSKLMQMESDCEWRTQQETICLKFKARLCSRHHEN